MKYFIANLTLLISLLYYVNSNATSFVYGFEDIPLMNGLIQINDNNISFGNEETRFVEAQLEAKNRIKFHDIQKFYTETLLQLGWNLKNKTESKIVFHRENDILEINKIASIPLKISINIKNTN